MAIKIHDLAPAPGSTKARKRVGRGIAAGGGKTAGRGTKGQKARRQVRPGFEGGQTSLYRRLPKLRGFTNPFRVEYAAVNLSAVQQALDRGITEVTPDSLRRAGLAPKRGLIKILADGELRGAATVRAHAFSAAAAQAITAAGGTVERLPLPFAVRPPAKGNALTNR